MTLLRWFSIATTWIRTIIDQLRPFDGCQVVASNHSHQMLISVHFPPASIQVRQLSFPSWVALHSIAHVPDPDAIDVGAVLPGPCPSPVLENTLTLSLVSVPDLCLLSGAAEYLPAAAAAAVPALALLLLAALLVGELGLASSANGDSVRDAEFAELRFGLAAALDAEPELDGRGCSIDVDDGPSKAGGGLPPCASRRRYSTHRFEKLCSRPAASAVKLSSPAPPAFPAKALVARLIALRLELPKLTLLGFPTPVLPPAPAPFTAPIRCSPARSRSSSPHDRMDASRLSISNRLLSARGVLKKVMSTFVTNRRSTLFSELSFLSRRRASVKCSLRITAVDMFNDRKAEGNE